MEQRNSKSTVSIRIAVVGIFIFASVIVALVAIGLQYHFSKSMTYSYTLQLYNYAANDISEYFNRENDQTVLDTALLAHSNNDVIGKMSSLATGQTLHPDTLKLFANTMARHDEYYSIYIGFPNGNLTQLVNVNEALNNRKTLKAGSTDRWVLTTIFSESGRVRQRKYEYFDENFNLRTTRYEETDYDATHRPWYKSASFLKVNKSEAYVYAQSGTLGQTYSVKIPHSDMVLGLDVTLNSLSKTLKKNSKDQNGVIFDETYIFTGNGDVLASNRSLPKDYRSAKLTTLAYPKMLDLIKDKDNINRLHSLMINDEDYYLYVSPIGNQTSDDTYLGILTPKELLLSRNIDRVKTSIFITAAVLLALLSLSYFFVTPIIRPIKALAAEANKIKNRQYDQVKPVKSFITEIQELNNSMENMYKSIEQHEVNQSELMESFIKLIAQAIDDKSPYTAGHCNRVPELGQMLAEAVESSNLPPFQAFKFNSEDERREFRIAAWLHDCGKITTPEDIVDKGTKLEVIYNRIHEIRMRFEVLLRDAEIRYYQGILKAPEDEAVLKDVRDKEKNQLTIDFEFIAQSNIGSEGMSEKAITRLEEMAQKTWQRHFDDRLGLSPVEELNIDTEPQTLPVTENLLSDKAKHIIPHTTSIEFDPKFGIKMDVPEHLYNQGELYNLSIIRGTLTKEDRFKINQHITSTIKMLEALPFPAELARVPRYASTHHETLKGTGFPRKLSKEDLSIPERVLVIADIFEALTAGDRPYKKAKSLSVAISILHKMAVVEHIDIDLFKLFLSSGVYLQYAEKFLDDAQIDDVDIDQYLI